MGWYEQTVAFITQTTREHQAWIDDLPGRIADPGLVALLVGKASVASERGIAFSVSGRSRLGPTNGLSEVLATVTGNLIENAFDAVEGQPRREVVVHLRERDGEIRADVRDCGPGFPRPLVGRIFETGFSTKRRHGLDRADWGWRWSSGWSPSMVVRSGCATTAAPCSRCVCHAESFVRTKLRMSGNE